ncbi:MAG TPA: Sec-independent protein translocase subunit TatA [Pseudonocardiaceae bacterium]|nr:Sec-independent protein translocase subunit TatA [Pseudonocardiaceae bacterium]
MAGLTGWHLLILIAVIVLLFGAKRLPEMARALGQSARILQREIKDTAATEQTHTQHPAPQAPPHLTPIYDGRLTRATRLGNSSPDTDP